MRSQLGPVVTGMSCTAARASIRGCSGVLSADLPSGRTPNANTELTSSTSDAAAATTHAFFRDGTGRDTRWRRRSSATKASDSHCVAISARGCGVTGVRALARATSAATACSAAARLLGRGGAEPQDLRALPRAPPRGAVRRGLRRCHPASSRTLASCPRDRFSAVGVGLGAAAGLGLEHRAAFCSARGSGPGVRAPLASRFSFFRALRTPRPRDAPG